MKKNSRETRISLVSDIMFHKSVDKFIRLENKAVQCISRNTGSFSVLKRKMWGKMQHWLLGYTTMVESNEATHS